MKNDKTKPCSIEEDCHENFEYNDQYEFIDFGLVRFFGSCSKCGKKGWEDFEYSEYDWE